MSNKAENGKTVKVHYVGTFEDGTEFDNSREREEALTFQLGSGQLIEGFNNAVVDMSPGETKEVTLKPENAYGQRSEELFQEVTRQQFPEEIDFQPGMVVTTENSHGTPTFATIREFGEETVLLDFNHPMAGKTLNFSIELLEVLD